MDSLGDVAYSLATTRSHFRHRLVLMARDRDELLDKLATVDRTASPADKPRVAMLFTGQGGLLPGMGRQLASRHGVFRVALEEIAAQFGSALDRPLLDVMWAEAEGEAAALLRRTEYAQPALFALEVALWRLWQSWGVRPAIVLGHSVGELAAAHVAGIMGLADACRLVAARGRLMQALPGDGAMVSLQAGAAEVARVIETLSLGGKADVAAYNAPAQTAVSGDAAAVEALAGHFTAMGRKLPTYAFQRERLRRTRRVGAAPAVVDGDSPAHAEWELVWQPVTAGDVPSGATWGFVARPGP